MQGEKLIKKYSGTNTGSWSLIDIPGLYQEDFVHNPWDYAELIRFQLLGYMKKGPTYVQDGTRTHEKFVPSWNEFAKKLLSLSSFQNYLNFNQNKLKNTVAEITNETDVKTDKIKEIYYYVSKNIVWNGIYSISGSKNIPKLLKDKNGNSADINLFLVGLLRNAGFEAEPMILSTKSHGRISKDYPMISFFNHIICAVKIGSVYQLLDATDPYRSYNLLAVQDLNYYGFMLKETNPQWMDIPMTQHTRRNIEVKIDYTNKDQTSYEYLFEYDGYDALTKRKQYFNNKEDFFEKHLDINTLNVKLDSFSVENAKIFNKPFFVRVYCHTETNPFTDKDMVYLEPFPVSHFDENPFLAEKRISPIDFAYTFADNITLRVYYPEGYEVDEKPKTESLVLLDATGKYKYKALDIENYLKIESTLIIDETRFFVKEYEQIRTFFSEVIKKPSELIVLKKK